MYDFLDYISGLEKNKRQALKKNMDAQAEVAFLILYRSYLLWLLEEKNQKVFSTCELLKQAALANDYYVNYLGTLTHFDEDLPSDLSPPELSAFDAAFAPYVNAVKESVRTEVVNTVDSFQTRKLSNATGVLFVATLASLALVGGYGSFFVKNVVLAANFSPVTLALGAVYMAIVVVFAAGVASVAYQNRATAKAYFRQEVQNEPLEKYVSGNTIVANNGFKSVIVKRPAYHGFESSLVRSEIHYAIPAHVEAKGGESETLFTLKKIAVDDAMDKIERDNINGPVQEALNLKTPSEAPAVAAVTDAMLNKYKGVYTSYQDFMKGKGFLDSAKPEEVRVADVLANVSRALPEKKITVGV